MNVGISVLIECNAKCDCLSANIASGLNSVINFLNFLSPPNQSEIFLLGKPTLKSVSLTNFT